MDFDDFVEYDLIFNDDEPHRHHINPPPDNGCGCLIGVITVLVIVVLALILG